MPQVRYNIATSLDGYIASTNYTTPWIVEDQTIDFKALYAQFALFIMGRRTSDTFLGMGADNPFLDPDLRKKTIVLSRNADQGDDYKEIRVVNGSVRDMVQKAMQRMEVGGEKGDIWVMGGAGVASELIKGEMLDMIEVAVMPVLLGQGVKVLDALGCGDDGVKLKLRECEVKESGILMTTYAVVRPQECIGASGQ